MTLITAVVACILADTGAVDSTFLSFAPVPADVWGYLRITVEDGSPMWTLSLWRDNEIVFHDGTYFMMDSIPLSELLAKAAVGCGDFTVLLALSDATYLESACWQFGAGYQACHIGGAVMTSRNF